MISTRNKVEVEHKTLRTDERIEIAKSLIGWLSSNVPVPDRSFEMECIEQTYKMLKCMNFGRLQITKATVQPIDRVDIDIAAEIFPGSFVFFPASFRIVP